MTSITTHFCLHCKVTIGNETRVLWMLEIISAFALLSLFAFHVYWTIFCIHLSVIFSTRMSTCLMNYAIQLNYSIKSVALCDFKKLGRIRVCDRYVLIKVWFFARYVSVCWNNYRTRLQKTERYYSSLFSVNNSKQSMNLPNVINVFQLLRLVYNFL